MLLKCCTQYASKSVKLSSGHRTGKVQFSFQSQRKVLPKNIQTTAPVHSFHILVGNAQNPSIKYSLVFNPVFYVNCELPDAEAGFRKGRGIRDQIANIHYTRE